MTYPINFEALTKSVEDCYPFNAEPTTEMSNMLKKRVNQIENSIIPNVDEIELPPFVNGIINKAWSKWIAQRKLIRE